MRSKHSLLILVSVLFLSGCTLEFKECKDGETRCVGDSVNLCEEGEWTKYSPCVKQKCEETDGVAACVNICEQGDTKCSGNVLLTCTEENIWPPDSQGIECKNGETCMSVQTLAFCANPNSSSTIVEILSEHDIECNADLRLCGENNSLYTCEEGTLNEFQQCGNQICGQTADGQMACVDVCQPGVTKCEGNNLVTCTDSKVFGKPEACVNDTVCMKNDSVYACVKRNSSLKLCTENQCVGNILYQCKDGVYDNGTECDGGCELNYLGRYSCASSVCKPGETRCAGKDIEECKGENVWQVKSSAPEHAFCAVRENSAEYICELGYTLVDGACKLLCVEGCSDDGKMATTCPETGLIVKTLCEFGCDPENGKCQACVSGCSEDGKTLTVCSGVGIVNMSCPAGCNATQLKCNECVPGCATNGEYAVECQNGVPVNVPCSDGCNTTTHHCNSCKKQCSSDGQYLIKCLPNDTPENEYCPSGCNSQTLACNQCETTCTDGVLHECQKDGSIVDKPCNFGCASNNACNPCKSTCTDGVFHECLITDPELIIIADTPCPFGCDDKSEVCAKCTEDACSQAKNSVYECDENGEYKEVFCKLTGWKDGTCKDAQCIYTECAEGYTKQDDTCVPES
ncbi:MAG: hypothetical protein IJU23_06045 [Proteobacteria bacterium]|nr:hypothetical protein [Pseudomonadota bacterium]